MLKACTKCGTPCLTGRCAKHPKTRSPSGKATSKYSHKQQRLKLSRTCHICGEKIKEKDLHADHVVPVSKGGENMGMKPAHSWCNLRRGTKELET